MRKFFVIMLSAFLFTGCGILGNMSNRSMSYNKYIDGYWGEWERFSDYGRPSFYGTPGNFIVYSGTNHKSDFHIKVEAFNCNISIKDKDAIKAKRWFTYKGQVTFKTEAPQNCRKNIVIRSFVDCYFGNLNGNGRVITVPATIKIYPMRDRYCYNIYFDGLGVGLNIPWQIAR